MPGPPVVGVAHHARSAGRRPTLRSRNGPVPSGWLWPLGIVELLAADDVAALPGEHRRERRPRLAHAELHVSTSDHFARGDVADGVLGDRTAAWPPVAGSMYVAA